MQYFGLHPQLGQTFNDKVLSFIKTMLWQLFALVFRLGMFQVLFGFIAQQLFHLFPEFLASPIPTTAQGALFALPFRCPFAGIFPFF